MFLHAADLTDRHLVIPDSRLLLAETGDHLIRNGEDLRLHKRKLLTDPDRSALRLQLQLLIAGIACVLIVTHERIASHAIQLQRTIIVYLQRFIEIPGTLPEPPLVLSDLCGQFLRLLKFLLPKDLVGIYIFEAPGHFCRHLFSLW